MKHSSTWFALILIALALLPSIVRVASAVESKNHSTQNHQAETTPQPESIEKKEPVLPFAIWQATVSALHKSVADNEQQAIAAQKQAEANKETFCSPAVVVNEVLAFVGFCYLLLMYLQWKAIDRQARLADEALRMDVRPRISVKIEGGHAPLNLTGKNEQQFVIYYKVRNTGRGPAFVTRQNQCFLYLSDPNDPLPPEPPESPHDTPIGGIITGGDDVPCDVGSEKFSSEKFDRIQQGLTRAFWMVLIEYRDERRQPHVYREPSVYEPGSGRWIYPPNAPDSWSESS